MGTKNSSMGTKNSSMGTKNSSMKADNESNIRGDRARYLDVNKESDKVLPYIPVACATNSIASLREAVKPVENLIEDLADKVEYSLEKCKRPKDGLTQNESASLYLYSMQWPPGKDSFYTMFNWALRDEDRTKAVLYQDYCNLFMSALSKLPSRQDDVWRGVNGDLSEQYGQGTTHVWRGATSCSNMVHVTDSFLNSTSSRTLFKIKCFQGKSIENHSAFPNEKETVLPPGTCLRVKSQSNPAPNFYIVDLEQIVISSEQKVAPELSFFHLIWLRPYADKILQQTEIKLLKLFPISLKTFEDSNECETFIRQESSSQTMLIVSGQLGREIVPKMHDLSNIMAIFVYSINKQANEEWTKNYKKVKAVVSNPTDLISELERLLSPEESINGSFAERLTNIEYEPDLMLTPISGYEKLPLLSLEEALKPLKDIIPGLEIYVQIVKQNSLKPVDELTPNESAAIQIYTMEMEVAESSLSHLMNIDLCSIDRCSLTKWFPYLKLFMTALHKLKSRSMTLYRGVKVDVSQHYTEGQRGVWWGCSTVTMSIGALQECIGTTGACTMFMIECRNAKVIRAHSFFNLEHEVLLIPGFYFEVKSKLHQGNLMIIYLKEVEPPFQLIASPFEQTTPSPTIHIHTE
ncbi:unnamed protein product [Rotaria socialis]